MRKNILAVFTIFSACMAFCAKAKMPEWITVPSSVYPSNLYFNGTGSGESREVAELEAVKNLSSVFGQTVKSNNLASKKMEQALSDGQIAFSSSGISGEIKSFTFAITAEIEVSLSSSSYIFDKTLSFIISSPI